MFAEIKYTVQFLVLSMFLYTVIYCVEFSMESIANISRIEERDNNITPKPSECFGTDAIEFAKCCVAPPFFSREIALKCGVKGALRYTIPEQNITGLLRIGLSCESWTCILDQYHLLVDDLLDDKRFNVHLTRWVKLNPEFNETIAKAKEHCRKIFILDFPMDPCFYRNYHSCYRNYINVDCPVRVNSTICDEQKKFYDECREYFLKK
ncbi:hypothetical protein NE865_09587 [Phthorimaea operculella]|nr:hypothetical protein NE865_09587 [Phthorimaea operculella]